MLTLTFQLTDHLYGCRCTIVTTGGQYVTRVVTNVVVPDGRYGQSAVIVDPPPIVS